MFYRPLTSSTFGSVLIYRTAIVVNEEQMASEASSPLEGEGLGVGFLPCPKRGESVKTFRMKARSGGIFLLLWHFCPRRPKEGLIFNGSWKSTGYKGTFYHRKLRKYRNSTRCCQTKQRMKAKIERREGKVNVEERATQRGVSAYTTWSIEKETVQHRPIPHVAA